MNKNIIKRKRKKKEKMLHLFFSFCLFSFFSIVYSFSSSPGPSIAQFQKLEQKNYGNYAFEWNITNSTEKIGSKDNKCKKAHSYIYAWGSTNPLILSDLNPNMKSENDLNSARVVFTLEGKGINKGLHLKTFIFNFPSQNLNVDISSNFSITGHGKYELDLQKYILRNILNSNNNLSISIEFSAQGTDVDLIISCIQLKINDLNSKIDSLPSPPSDSTKEENTHESTFFSTISTTDSTTKTGEGEKKEKDDTNNYKNLQNSILGSIALFITLCSFLVLIFLNIKERKNEKTNPVKKQGKIIKTRKHELYRKMKKQKFYMVKRRTDDCRDLIKKEFIILEDLKHENVITVYNYIYSMNNPPGYLMEYTQLGNLYVFMYGFEKNNKEKDESWDQHFNFKTKLSFYRDLCNGLSYLHENGIIHSNILPDNILVFNETEKQSKSTDVLFKLKFCGFSNAFKENTSPLYQEFYTLKYVPEEVFRNGDYSRSSDIWSLIILIYEIHLHKQPFYSMGEIDYMNNFKDEKLLEFYYMINELPKFDSCAKRILKSSKEYRMNRGVIEELKESLSGE